MGRSRAQKAKLRSHTLPSSPSRSFSSSSSSDFEFNICSSPRNNSSATADDLFYKGKLLPLHLSPRLSMVRTLLLASSSTSSSSDTTTSSTSASRDSSGSSSSSDAIMFADYNCDSSRPSSVTDLEDGFLKQPLNNAEPISHDHKIKNSKYFSLAKISSVFRKEPRTTTSAEPITTSTNNNVVAGAAKKGMSASARDVFKRYIKKVKPLYEKLSHTQKQIKIESPTACLVNPSDPKSDMKVKDLKSGVAILPHSFSGNLWYTTRKKEVASSCPSSMRTSPCHSGVLTRTGLPHPIRTCSANGGDSSMEEQQSAIQGAIAHCKNSMLQSRTE